MRQGRTFVVLDAGLAGRAKRSASVSTPTRPGQTGRTDTAISRSSGNSRTSGAQGAQYRQSGRRYPSRRSGRAEARYAAAGSTPSAGRLWPTTPALLRQTTRATAWWPTGTTSVIYTPFFHRDADTLPYADTFSPHIWLDGTAKHNPALVAFSAGNGECPGRNIVPLTATMLAALLTRHEFTLVGKPAFAAGQRLPASLDHTSLRFAIGK